MTDEDLILIDYSQILDEKRSSILREEIEAAVKALKTGNSAGVDRYKQS